MPGKSSRKKLPTDRQTDYLFDFFINEDKFNEQMKPVWDEHNAKKLQNHQLADMTLPKVGPRPNIGGLSSDKRGITRPDQGLKTLGAKSVKHSISPTNQAKELPTHTARSSSSNVDFNDSDDSSDSDETSNSKSIGKHIQSAPAKPNNTPFNKKIPAMSQLLVQPAQPVLGDQDKKSDKPNRRSFIGETPEQKRARAREAFTKLQDLVEKYNIQLTRQFSVHDDPDEMEDEYDIQKERRNKTNQVKFYKQVLLNIVCGVEFLNDKYDPFEFKLKDWSKQVAADMNDYTEVLEEIYEKYKDKGGKMAPEIRLLFMIIMSGITYHLSHVLFSSTGFSDTIKNNPSLINKFLNGFMKNGTNNDQEPAEARKGPAPNKKDILAAVREHNKNKQLGLSSASSPNSTTDQSVATDTSMTTETQPIKATIPHVTSAKSAPSGQSVQSVPLPDPNQMMEQRIYFEDLLRKQRETFNMQIEQLQHQNSHLINNLNNQHQNSQVSQIPDVVEPIPQQNLNQTPTKSSPRAKHTNLISLQQVSDDIDIFASEIKSPSNKFRPSKSAKSAKSVKPIKSAKPTKSVKKAPVANFDSVETLEETTDVSFSDVKISDRKTRSNNKSATRSASKKTGNRSDTTPGGRPIVKL